MVSPMTATTIRHDFDCDPDTYWRALFLDDEFNRRLYLEHLGFEAWELLSHREDGDSIERSVRIVPTTGSLPAPLKKLASGGIGYREEGRLDRAANRYSFRVVPNSMPDKLDIRGRMFTEPRGSGIARVIELEVKAKLFGVGGLVEKQIIQDTEKSYDRAYDYMRRHLSAAS